MRTNYKNKQTNIENKIMGLTRALENLSMSTSARSNALLTFKKATAYLNFSAKSGTMSHGFNMRALGKDMIKLYLGDLARFIGMEIHLLSEQRKLYALRKHAILALAA